MASSEGAAVQEKVPVSTELLREARQYRTVQTVQQWPLVTNSTTALLDGYQTLKKERELARVVLNISEDLASVFCQVAVLPVARSPLVKSPLKMADWVGGSGTALLQKAIPRLTDTKQPLRPNAELLLSLLLVPLTLSVALGRDLLQFSVGWLVGNFPDLKPAAAGFEEKSLLAQCATMALLLWVYLPLQLLSQPVETVRRLASVPSLIANGTITWVRETAAIVMDELTSWVGSLSQHAMQAVTWVAATVQTSYYVAFQMTGLEPALKSALEWARSLLKNSWEGAGKLVSTVTEAAPVSGLVDRVANLDVAPVRWARELFWCGGDSQRAEGERRAAGRGGGGRRSAGTAVY